MGGIGEEDSKESSFSSFVPIVSNGIGEQLVDVVNASVSIIPRCVEEQVVAVVISAVPNIPSCVAELLVVRRVLQWSIFWGDR